jgi:Outer membrane lipoprotein-sorting protein
VRTRLLSLSVRWVACLIALGCCAQSRVPSAPALDQLTPEQGQAFLAGFRNSRLNSALCLHFEIIHKPRKGESLPAVKGTLWAASYGSDQLLRGEIKDTQGRSAFAFITIKSGKESRVWISRDGAPAQELSAKAPLIPLAEGLLLTPFDLQLPFTHWPATAYLSTEKRRRPVHVFDALNQPGHEPAKVNYAIDHVYGVLIQATYFDTNGKKTRTMQIEEFSKVDEQWMLAACSLLDEKTRDADLLRITEVALGERFAPSIFEPTTLTQPAAQPANFKKL